jgi:predicted XRE-type DNA-binding protein
MKNNEMIYEAKNAGDLADLIDLDPADAIEIDLRAKLNKKIIDAVAKRGLTHVEVARRAGASRTRITAILNGNTVGVSTDLLLRILYSLGYKARVSFEPASTA